MTFTKKFIPVFFLSLFLFVAGCGEKSAEFIDTPGKDDPAYEYELVQIETDMGDILIWLYFQTPLHQTNFLKLAKEGFYDGLIFHRVIDGFVIQGGDPDGDGTGGPGYTTDAEIFDELDHKYGAVAAARLGDNVNPDRKSSGSQFYIVENAGGTHFLDNEYTVFGQVVDGMTVVEEIADQATNANDKPLDDVVMNKVTVIKYTNQELSDQFGFAIDF